MKFKDRLLFGFWLAFCINSLVFASPTRLTMDTLSLELEPFAEILLDKDGSLSPMRVASPDMAEQFKPLGDAFALGFTSDTVWLKFTLVSDQDGPWWLEIGQPILESHELYEVRTDMAEGTSEMAPIAPMESRRPTFQIELAKGTPKVLYLRLWSRTSMASSLTIWRPEALLPRIQTYNLISGMVLGAYLLVIVFYALFSWWTRAKIHIYYTLYVCVNFMAAFLTGLWNFTLGWQLNPAVHTTLLGIFISLAIVCSSLFTVEFVQSKREWPKVSKTYIGVCILAACLSIITILNSYYREAAVYFQSFTILTIIFTTCALIYLTYHGNHRARFILIALTIFHIGIAWRFMRNMGIIEPNTLNDNAYQIGAFVHMLIMSTGIFSSYNKLRQQSDKESARADAEAALRLRQKEFLNIVAHEVKTPLSVISAAADNLQINSKIPEAAQPRIEKIIRNAEKIRVNLERYLGHEQLLNSSATLNAHPVNLSKLCALAIKDFQETHDVTVTSHIASDVMIEADASLLNVVIANLLDNAFKHNPIGTAISLKLSKGAIDEVTLCVEDEGIGVRNQELPQIFDAYFRGANAVGTAGSGLGLHLVQYIATQHHGTVSATQREGGGMRFSMHLPAAQERLH